MQLPLLQAGDTAVQTIVPNLIIKCKGKRHSQYRDYYRVRGDDRRWFTMESAAHALAYQELVAEIPEDKRLEPEEFRNRLELHRTAWRTALGM